MRDIIVPKITWIQQPAIEPHPATEPSTEERAR